MILSRSGIFAEAISIASTSLNQRQSISLASFLQCPHFRSSRPKLFCKKRCLRPATLLKKRLLHRCFPVNFAKFLRTPFLKEHLILWWPIVTNFNLNHRRNVKPHLNFIFRMTIKSKFTFQIDIPNQIDFYFYLHFSFVVLVD